MLRSGSKLYAPIEVCLVRAGSLTPDGQPLALRTILLVTAHLGAPRAEVEVAAGERDDRLAA